MKGVKIMTPQTAQQVYDEIVKKLTPIIDRECVGAEVVCSANPENSLKIRIKWKTKQGSKTITTQPLLIKLHEDLLSSEFFERHRFELDVVFTDFIRNKLAKLKPQEGKKSEYWDSAQYWIFPDNC